MVVIQPTTASYAVVLYLASMVLAWGLIGIEGVWNALKLPQHLVFTSAATIDEISRSTLLTTYAGFAIVQGGKLIMQAYCSTDEIGVYTLHLTAGMAAAVFLDAIVLTVQPIYYRSKSNSKQYYLLLLSSMPLLIAMLGAVVFALVYDALEVHLPVSYQGNMQIARMVFVAFSIRGCYMLMQLWFVDTERLGLFTFSYVISGILSVIACLCLVPIWGGFGAAVSQVFGFSLLYAILIALVLRASLAESNNIEMRLDINEGK